jgi:hypothetical protein
MNALYMADFHQDVLKITNPKIISFYESNPHIDFETVNLMIIDILQKNSNCKLDNIENTILYPEDSKIKEIDNFITNLRDSIGKLIHVISSKYIGIKSEYIRDFKSVSKESDPRELLHQTNQIFFEKSCSLLSVAYHLRFSNINEKVKVMLTQFNKILTSNTEQIFAKPTTTSSRNVEEYINNFESNSTHMIQAIVKLLSECLTSYELRVKNAIDSIKRREDPSFSNYYKLIYELNDTLHQLPNTAEDTESAGVFEQLLSRTFTTASISRESGANEYILSREDKPEIYIETQNVREHNIGVSDVKRFIKRAIEKNTNSILISQYTGITSKPNYHIEIHNKIVVIFLHKMLYSQDTIQIATDMIDALSSKLTDFCSLSNSEYSIPKDILDNVNREYQQFILQKETIVTAFKDHHKRLLSQLDDMRFSTLDKYLSTRYSSCKKQGYNCDLCNNFNVGTLKGLAAHKRGCARKLNKTSLIDDCMEKKPAI